MATLHMGSMVSFISRSCRFALGHGNRVWAFVKGQVPGLDKYCQQTSQKAPWSPGRDKWIEGFGFKTNTPYGTLGRWWEFPAGHFIFDIDLYDEFSLMTVCVQSKKGMLEKSEPAEPHKTTFIMTTEPLKAPPNITSPGHVLKTTT